MITLKSNSMSLSFTVAMTVAIAASVLLLGMSTAPAADAEPAVSQGDTSVEAPADGETTNTESVDEFDKQQTTVDEYLLRYKFRRGQFVHYEEVSGSKKILMARGQTQTISETRRINKHFRVVTVDENGSAVVEPVIDRVRLKVQNDDAPTVEFDSDDADADAKDFKAVKETIGRAALRIRYSHCGRIEQLLPIQDQPEVVENMEDYNFLVAFPKEALAIGGTWDDRYIIDVNVDGKLRNPLKKQVTIKRIYKLKNVKSGIAEIGFRTYPLRIERDPRIKAELVHHSLFGAIRFDVEKGIILEWKSEGTGHVFDVFGPTSSMQAQSSSVERYIASPVKRRVKPAAPRRPAGPAGPQIPGTASLQ